MHAEYATIDQHPALKFERRIGHPVEAVWRAITEPDELEQWFPTAVAVDLRVGGEMTFTFAQHTLPDGSNTMRGQVTDLDPPKLFAFYWGEDHLRFEFEPTDGGDATVLRLTALLDAKDKAARDAAGWHQCLDGLERLLDGEVKRPSDSDAWRTYYERYAAEGFPTGAALPG
jgi:uncharacterized protein YndB with AHSA1/START domain